MTLLNRYLVISSLFFAITLMPSLAQGQAVEFATTAGLVSRSNDFFKERLESISNLPINEPVRVPSSQLYDLVSDGTYKMGTGLAGAIRPGGTSTQAMRLAQENVPFGLTADEYLSFLYEAGGLELIQGIVDAIAGTSNVIVLPFHLAAPQATGWFPEALPKSVQKLNRKGWSLRITGLGRSVMQEAFPELIFPAGTPGISSISDLCAGTFDGIEFADPDADLDFLFVDETENPVVCGAPHYYLGTWHDQTTLGTLLLNADWFDSLSNQDRERIVSAARESTIQSLSRSYARAAAALSAFVDHGAIVHERVPEKILMALRDATEVVLEESAAVDHHFETLLSGIRQYAKGISPYLTNGSVAADERFNEFAGWESDI